MKDIISGLNKLFESRVRLGVMSILVVNDWIDFNTLKDMLGVTDGNLASHLSALEKNEYIIVSKQFVRRKPKTTYKATDLGINSFKKHLDMLERLIRNQDKKK